MAEGYPHATVAAKGRKINMKRTVGLALLMMLALSACVTVPSGPRVHVMPAPGKPFDLFVSEDYTCRRWASGQVGISTQDAVNQNMTTGAVAGSIVGAGIGAALGSVSGHAGQGAAIGAGTGLLFGTAQGAENARYYGEEAQRRYDIAYTQCMYSYGNQVPGMMRQNYQMVPPPPPPPPASFPEQGK